MLFFQHHKTASKIREHQKMNSNIAKINPPAQTNPETKIAKNLKALLAKEQLSANQLARMLNIPPMTIRRLITGETADPRISTLKLIAHYFNVSVDALSDAGEQTPIKLTEKTKPHLVPIISWNIAEKNALNDLDLKQWKTWQPISLNEKDTISANAFALESRPSMHPRFPQGTIFIIDPSVTSRDGDIVLVRIKKDGALTLRELVIDAPERRLEPITSGSNSLQYSPKEYEIIGVNVLTMLYNRRNHD